MLPPDHDVEAIEATGPSSKATNVAEAAIQKTRDNAGSEESRRSRDENQVADADDLPGSWSRSLSA